MKKKMALLVGVTAFSVILIGCEEREIYYKGQLRPVSQVEEILSDELEIENPELDFEVGIYEEIE